MDLFWYVSKSRIADMHYPFVLFSEYCVNGSVLAFLRNLRVVQVHDIRQRDPVKKFENRFSQTSVAFSDTAEQLFAGNIENDIVVGSSLSLHS